LERVYTSLRADSLQPLSVLSWIRLALQSRGGCGRYQLETIGFKTKTTDAGRSPFLICRKVYAVSVTRAGSPQKSEITLGTAQALRIDINLKVGTVESTIEVKAQAARVQTDTTSVSGATQSNVIDLIPNISQNPIYYAILQAGVQPRNATADTTSNNSFGIGVNGRRQYSATASMAAASSPMTSAGRTPGYGRGYNAPRLFRTPRAAGGTSHQQQLFG
jgi:hypothetical protein